MSKRRGSRPSVKSSNILRASPKNINTLSSYRKEILAQDVNNGIIKEGSNYNNSNLNKNISTPKTKDYNSIRRGDWREIKLGEKSEINETKLSIASIAHSETYKDNKLKKEADSAFSSRSTGGTTVGSSFERLAPEVYSPLFTMANLNLPRDRITVNAWCFLPGTKVLMRDGTKKNIEDLKIGEYVISGNGNIRKITSLFKRDINEEIVGVSFINGQNEVWSTKNHGFNIVKYDNIKCNNNENGQKRICRGEEKCKRCGKDISYNFKKIAVGKLEKDDVLYTPIPKIDGFIELNEKEIELLGYYAAEGSISKCKNSYETNFTFSYEEKNTVLYIKKLIKEIFNYEASLSYNDSCSKIRCYTKEIYNWFKKHCNGDSLTKKLSLEIVLAPVDLLKIFLKAWADGDGHQCKQYAGIRFDGKTSSYDLACQIEFMANRCKYISSIYKNHYQKTICSNITNYKEYKVAPNYLIRLAGKSAKNFFDNYNDDIYRFKIRDKTERLSYGNSFINKNKIIRRIKSIKTKFYSGPVYNIEVEKDNTYVVGDGISVHNCRNFFQLHPIVRNAITLHATYPISKINVKCHDKKVLNFFEDMIEEMDLMRTLGELSLEYWSLGEVFPFAELDENSGKWAKIIIQNPDYILVKKSVFAGEPVISLKPDQVLQRLAMSNNPADVQLRKQIPENILYHIRKGEAIPLDNFNISHLKMTTSPYDIRGTSVIVSVFKDLMLYDKLRECYSDDTEYLTDRGFLKYEDITENNKLATFNKENENLEYQNFTDRIQYHYNGDMFSFFGKKIDTLVTPNHRMWLAQSKSHGGYNNFDFIKAEDVKQGYFYKSRASVKWEGKEIKYKTIFNKKIKIEEYLKFLGYLISEGCIYYDENKYNYSISANQSENSDIFNDMKESFNLFSNDMNLHCCHYKRLNTPWENKKENLKDIYNMCSWSINNKLLTRYIRNEIGSGSYNKKIPNWIKQLSPRLLKILLEAMIGGDGTIFKPNGVRKNSIAYRYNTVSKQLADDVSEIALKAGYAPRLKYGPNGQGKYYYTIAWSESNYGKFPGIYGNKKQSNNGGGGSFKKIKYDGNVSCFTVSNGLLITRRNGLITIQGNCKFAQADGLVNPITLIKVGGNNDGEYRATQEDIEYYKNIFEQAQYDKDAKIITHAGITAERVGASGQIVDIGSDMDMIVKNIYTGLMVPQAIVDTESAAYSSASIGLEVLRQRYFNFRNMIAKWLTNKIFAPISEIQNFYEYDKGYKRLIIPEIEWNQMNLYDLQDYIGNISGLVGNKQASLQTLYRSLGLNYQDEIVKMRQEMINDAIKMKEEQNLQKMTISELKVLDPEKEVNEPIDDKEREVQAAPPEAGGLEMGGFPGGEMGGGLGELAPPPGGGELGMGGAPAGPGGAGGIPELGPGIPKV